MDVQKIKELKVEARDLSGVLGSLAHAQAQVDLYPESDSAQKYLREKTDKAVRLYVSLSSHFDQAVTE